MDEKSLFTQFWIKESKTTRHCVADRQRRKLIMEAIESGTAEWAPSPAPATMQELCAAYDAQSADIVHHRGQITTYLRAMGIDGAADLWAERGRAVGNRCAPVGHTGLGAGC